MGLTSILKENPSGGFYCSECRMSTSEPIEICPFCGSIISNWMDIIIQKENDKMYPPETPNPETKEKTWDKLVTIVRRKQE